MDENKWPLLSIYRDTINGVIYYRLVVINFGTVAPWCYTLNMVHLKIYIKEGLIPQLQSIVGVFLIGPYRWNTAL